MYSSIALMILCLVLDQATVRFYYEHEEKEYKSALLFKCVLLPIISCLAVSLIVIGLSTLHIFEFEFKTVIVIFLCIHTLDQIIYRFSLLVVRLEGNVKLFSALQILQKIVYIILAIGLCYIVKEKYVLLLVVATTFSYMICMIVSIIAQKNIWNFRFVKSNPVSYTHLVTKRGIRK